MPLDKDKASLIPDEVKEAFLEDTAYPPVHSIPSLITKVLKEGSTFPMYSLISRKTNKLLDPSIKRALETKPPYSTYSHYLSSILGYLYTNLWGPLEIGLTLLGQL